MRRMRGVAAAMVGVLVLFAVLGALAAIVRSHDHSVERDHRRALVHRLEREVTAAARARVAAGAIDGPILRTRCLPFEEIDQYDPGLMRGRYSCVAITFETDTNYNGHTFIGDVDYETGRIRFHQTEIPVYLGI